MKKRAKTRPKTKRQAAAPKARESRTHRSKRNPNALVPGELLLGSEPIEANAGKKAIAVEVANTGDRPVQVGSHFHFFEVNSALAFDRERAYGMRLDIASGTAVRFEPGQRKSVSLIPLGGRREVWGLRGLVDGALER
jgi:urease beta subunit